MKRVVFNQKGGVGKSSIAVNLAAISAHQGHRTLLIDLDIQCNATHYLTGALQEPPGADIANFFEQFLSFKLLADNPLNYITASPHERLHLIPSSPRLAELQTRLEAKHKIYKLRDALKRYEREYDLIYIDTPPALNFYTLSALIAADRCLIPFDCDQFSKQALITLMENLSEIKADHNEGLEVEGIVVNQFLASAKLPRIMVEELRADGLPVLDTMLPSSVKMRESHHESKPLIHLAPNHKLTQAFIDLHDEIS